MRILLVEDDDCIAKTLETILTKENYAIDIAQSGEIGWRYIETFTYDLILLDIVLPNLDGITLCRQLRSQQYQTPILLITAQHSSSERIAGLDAGADDYMTKPFDFPELLARIRVLLRRGQASVVTQLEWEYLRVDPTACKVTYRSRALHLTPKEYRLLELFLRNPQQVFSRSRILEHLWGCEENPGEDTVTAHIKGLRQKLKQAGAPTNLIETVYGIGYRLRQLSSNVPAEELSNQQTRAEIKTALRQLWEKFRGKNQVRLQVVQAAIAALQSGNLTHDLRQQAILNAHKLAGVLGVFDFHQGSQLALSIENRLRALTLPSDINAEQLAEWANQLAEQIQNGVPAPQARRSNYDCPVFVVDSSLDLVNQIIQAGQSRSLQIHLVNQSSSEMPDAWILNLPFSDAPQESLARLTELLQNSAFVAVLSDRSDLSWRVQVAQAGVHVIFPKLPVEQTITLIDRLRLKSTTATTRVLMVDDDPQVLAQMRSLLEPWGMELTTLENVPEFWEMLQSYDPDLLILDVEMPHYNGIELCQVVRSTPQWQTLPIVLFTVHTDANTIQQALRVGASHLMSKSISQSEVVHSIISQLERSRLTLFSSF